MLIHNIVTMYSETNLVVSCIVGLFVNRCACTVVYSKSFSFFQHCVAVLIWEFNCQNSLRLRWQFYRFIVDEHGITNNEFSEIEFTRFRKGVDRTACCVGEGFLFCTINGVLTQQRVFFQDKHVKQRNSSSTQFYRGYRS